MNYKVIAQVISESWGPIFADKGWTVYAREDLHKQAVIMTIQSDLGTSEHVLSPPRRLYMRAPALAEFLDDFLTQAIQEHYDLEPEVPLFTEKVIGYRYWRRADWVLMPTNYGYPWRPGVNTATCLKHIAHRGKSWSTYVAGPGCGKCPGKDCHCGLNAFYEYRGAKEHAGGDVCGAVVGWGDMRCHPDGFRAEFAEIIGLLDISVSGKSELQEIAETYKVPILTSVEDLQIEASKHGSPLPESIRPKENPTVPPSNPYSRGHLWYEAYKQQTAQITYSINFDKTYYNSH